MRPKKYALNDSLSPSEIKHLINGTPYAFYYHKYDNDDDFKSDSLIVGSYLHCKWLEPEKVKSRYYVAKYLPKNTKEGKVIAEQQQAEYKELLKKNPDLIYIEDRLTNQSDEIYESLKNNEAIQKILLQNKICETPIQDILSPVDGVKLKCIPDIILPDSGLIVDFKHMADISQYKFSQDVINYNYHVQAWINLYCVSKKFNKKMSDFRFKFLCISKQKPYEVVKYELADEYMIDAERRIIDALYVYEKATREGFVSYPTETQILAAPSWLVRELEDEVNIL